MSQEEQKELLSRKRSRPQSDRTPLQKMNRKLNIGIAIVSTLILIVTFSILNNRPTAPTPSKTDEQPIEQQQATEQPQTPSEADVASEEQTDEVISDEQTKEGHTISESADANVQEVWTNDEWEPFATKQTGSHTSVFEEGHIDYEEKLDAAFSVLPIERESSIVTSARNNGDAKSARIVVTTNDKSESYRVIINWIEGEGWLPTSVDVLYNVDGVR